MPLRVGIDLASVELVRDAIETHGDRYLERVYTARELSDCATGADGRPEPERLAARFAAKEATLKVLRPGEVGLPLTAIEVVRGPDGAVALELDGPAASLAGDAGISELTLSLTHEDGFAAAVVIATCA
ncbi:MAG: holo-ACP synthase [Solirubrobacterales bacterium]